jgi:deoxyribose-phosphate aldolase
MKFAEARFLIHQGAEELDMVLNIGALKEGNIDIIQREIGQVVNAADGNCVKVIIETCLLSTDKKVLACTLAQNSGADFVKTSTGFSSAGAIIEDVELMRETVGDEMGVKASGGIKTAADVKAMVDAGANRIGTSSSISIIHE